MYSKRIISIVFFYFLILGNTHSIEPDVFVQSTVNRASQTLSKDISKEEKMLELQELAKGDKFAV